jgi:hypothetical protein
MNLQQRSVGEPGAFRWVRDVVHDVVSEASGVVHLCLVGLMGKNFGIALFSEVEAGPRERGAKSRRGHLG